MPYRMVEGITEALSEYIAFVREVHFPQIGRRIHALRKGKKPSQLVKADEGDDEPIIIVVESSGLSTTNKRAIH